MASVDTTTVPPGQATQDTILKGPHWPEPRSIVADSVSPHGFVAVEAVGLDTRKHHTTTFPLSLWETLRAEGTEYAFNAPARPSFLISREIHMGRS